MALDRIMDIAGSGLSAQLVRMNTTASNIANSGVVAGSEAQAFRASPMIALRSSSSTHQVIRWLMSKGMCGPPTSMRCKR